MIRTLLFDPATGAGYSGTADGSERDDAIRTWTSSSEAIVWVDFSEVAAEVEADIMRRYFGLHPLAIQDAQRTRHPPKVEGFGDHTFVLLKGLDAQSRDMRFGTIQIAIFVGPRFLVTRHSAPSSSIDQLWAQCEQDPGFLARRPDALAITLSRIIVNRYLPILLGLEERLDEVEDQMLAQPTDQLLAELVGHKANLKKLRRIITYHVTLFETIRSTIPPGIREEMRHELTDVYEHLERSLSLTTLYYELASDLMDGYITLASHRLNQIVKTLTIVTTIFVPLSFMAGVYGMNFEYIPELTFRYGYFALLASMAVTAGGALYLMYRKGWMGQRP